MHIALHNHDKVPKSDLDDLILSFVTIMIKYQWVLSDIFALKFFGR
jgi:hypothetical protein